MADIHRRWSGLWLSVSDDIEDLSRWDAVCLAFDLVLNACLPLPKRRPSVTPERVIGAQLVVDKALDILQNKARFMAAVERDSHRRQAKDDAK